MKFAKLLPVLAIASLAAISCDSLGLGGTSSGDPVAPSAGVCPEGMTLNPNNSEECINVCTAGGKMANPLGVGCIGLQLGLNWDFLADSTEGNPVSLGGMEMWGGIGIGITYDKPQYCANAQDAKLTGCLELPATAAPLISPVEKPNFTNMIGIGIHQNALSNMMYSVVTSGLMNIAIDSAFLAGLTGGSSGDSSALGGLDISAFLGTDTIGFLWPELKEAFPGSPLAFNIRPVLKNPKTETTDTLTDIPTIIIGGAQVEANGAVVPADLTVRIPHLGFGVAVDIDGKGNFQNAAEVDAGMDVRVGIDIERVPSTSPFCQDPKNQGLTCCSDPTALCSQLALGIGFESSPNSVTMNTDVLDKGKATPAERVGEMIGFILNLAVGLIPQIGFDLSALIGEDLGVQLPPIEITINPVGTDKDSITYDNGAGDFLGIGIDILDGDGDGQPDRLSPTEIWTLISAFMCEIDEKDVTKQEAMDSMCTALGPSICDGTCAEPNICDDIRDVYCQFDVAPTTEVCTGVFKPAYCNVAVLAKDAVVCVNTGVDITRSTYCSQTTAQQNLNCPGVDPKLWCPKALCPSAEPRLFCPPAGDKMCVDILPAPLCAPKRSLVTAAQNIQVPNTLIQLQDASWGESLHLSAAQAKNAGLTARGAMISFIGEEGARDFTWKVDGGAWNLYGPSTFAVLPPLVEGIHTVEVKSRTEDRIFDPTPATLTFRVDNFGPEIRLRGGNIYETAPDHLFQVVVDDLQSPSHLIEVSHGLDEGTWTPYGNERSIRVSGLASGDHVLHVRARDDADNETVIHHGFRVTQGGGCTQTGWGGTGDPLLPIVLLFAAVALRLHKRRTS